MRRMKNSPKQHFRHRSYAKLFRKCFGLLCFLTISLVLLSIFLIDEDSILFEWLPISFSGSLPIDDSNENEMSMKEFQTSLSPFYPHLSLIIERENLTMLENQTKLILLANGFFDNPTWGFAGSNQTPAQIMNTLTCPFLKNYCRITTNLKEFSQADAVVYHIRDSINQRFAQRRRRRRQRFVFALWESPVHTPDLRSFQKFFNWTMTYRFDSDIVASYYFDRLYFHRSNPYYQRMLKENPNLTLTMADPRPSNETLAKKKLGTAAALISNCGTASRRMLLIKALQNFIDVKIYGKCGTPCPSAGDCRQYIADHYYFFLSFENSLCQDYTTEKFFATLPYPIVPVVFGRTNYSYFIPSSGFIDVDAFSSIETLGKFLHELRNDTERYLSYFAWKKDFAWGLGEFFRPFCDLCLRLHFDQKTKIIDDIHSWWQSKTCVQTKFFKTSFPRRL